MMNFHSMTYVVYNMIDTRRQYQKKQWVFDRQWPKLHQGFLQSIFWVKIFAVKNPKSKNFQFQKWPIAKEMASTAQVLGESNWLKTPGLENELNAGIEVFNSASWPIVWSRYLLNASSSPINFKTGI